MGQSEELDDDYWSTRAAIIKAAATKDDDALNALQKLYPKEFENILNFVKNQKKRIPKK